MTKSSLYSLNQDWLSTKTSSTTLGFSYLEFLLGTFPFSLPLRASVVFHHGLSSWWKDCQMFILPLCINPSSAYGKSQTPGPARIGSSWAFPLPLKAPPHFYSSVFQGQNVWWIHPLTMSSGCKFINYFPHLRTTWCGVLGGLGVYMSFYRKGLWKMQQEMEK